MNKVFRTGPDVQVALSTAVPRSIALNRAVPLQLPEAAPAAAAPTAAGGRDWRTLVKRGARLPFKIVYRAVRPFLGPITFRVRRYLAAEVQHDLLRYHIADQHAIERVSADILRETQSSRELLRQELLGGQQQALVAQRQQFEQRVDQMEQRSPERLLHLFEQTMQAQQQALAVQRQQFEQRIDEMEERSPARLLHLFEQMMHAQQEALLEQRQQLEERIAHMEAQQQQALTARFDRLEDYSYASARRVIIPSGPDRLLIKTEAGYVVCPSADLAVVALLAESGDLEPGTRLLIGRLLVPGDVYVDVGANLGLHTLAAGAALQRRGQIIAFEPFPSTRVLLEETLHINGLRAISTIHQAAVSDHTGRQSLYLGNTCGHHSLFALAGTDASPAAPVEVDTVRLDDMLARDAPVTLIKIDAEGAELEVLRGAAATVAANPDIGLIVEFGISHLARNRHGSAQWLAEFEAFGLDYQAIDPVSGALQRWDVAQLEAVDSINLLFARPASPLWSKAAST